MRCADTWTCTYVYDHTQLLYNSADLVGQCCWFCWTISPHLLLHSPCSAPPYTYMYVGKLTVITSHVTWTDAHKTCTCMHGHWTKRMIFLRRQSPLRRTIKRSYCKCTVRRSSSQYKFSVLLGYYGEGVLLLESHTVPDAEVLQIVSCSVHCFFSFHFCIQDSANCKRTNNF